MDGSEVCTDVGQQTQQERCPCCIIQYNIPATNATLAKLFMFGLSRRRNIEIGIKCDASLNWKLNSEQPVMILVGGSRGV